MRIQRLLPVAALLVAIAPAKAQNTVLLNRKWVEQHADRTSVEVNMLVKHPHAHPNTPEADGDMHVSGTATDIGLPMVAEIANAGLQPQATAVSAMKAAAGKATTLKVSGAWRLWFEHPSKKQTQFGTNAFHPDNTNPDHSFEIHPVTKVGAIEVGNSFKDIKGFEAYTADVAFPYFDKKKITVKANSTNISLNSSKTVYNYVEFDIELLSNPKKVSDGYIALATIKGDHDEEAANGPRRMIFVGNTLPESKIKTAKAGDEFSVLGVPRINLNAIMALVKKHGTEQFQAALPYEMIVVGLK